MTQNEIWLVYDGECPICRNVARFYKIKEAAGNLRLVDARNNSNNQVIGEINSLGLDLDKGMVIKIDDKFYHGADATYIMALIGSKSGIFNRINVAIFRSKFMAKILYPPLRALRNFALLIKGKSQINNLKISQPIFKSAFGKNWDIMPEAIRKHYMNRSFSNDLVVCEGEMEISFSKIFRIFAPVFSLLKLLIPREGKNIFTRVKLYSKPDSGFLHFERELFFPKDKSEKFLSKVIILKQNEAAEILNYNIAWKFLYVFENDMLLLKHKGYALYLFGRFIPLPVTFLFGKGYAENQALSADEFRMKMTINHALFGEIYKYQGRFKITQITQQI
ncbi:MAG: hypothetical protein K0R25_1253 [Rickettsiaceae bacterium]|jgi:predicted DCC family thiol-disulfide oxidoreductase YuxK|nr:hypothetical protein [Rickettsiaceae bacterium]